MAKENPTAASGGFSAKGIVRTGAGITGKNGASVNSMYKESVPPLTGLNRSVKVSPNVTVKAPSYKGSMQTYTDLKHNSKYAK